MMSGIFVEGRSKTLLYSSKCARLIRKEDQKNLPSKLVDLYCPKQDDHEQRTFKQRNKQNGSKTTNHKSQP